MKAAAGMHFLAASNKFIQPSSCSKMHLLYHSFQMFVPYLPKHKMTTAPHPHQQSLIFSKVSYCMFPSHITSTEYPLFISCYHVHRKLPSSGNNIITNLNTKHSFYNVMFVQHLCVRKIPHR